ncbi:hypothetical protein Tco_0429102 [Tanacetum coccineum]
MQKERDKVSIQDFCEEHYDDILPIIMDKVHRDKRKEVHTRLDFAKSSEKGRRTREGSQNSSAGVSAVRYHTSSRRPRVQDRLRYNDENVFNQIASATLKSRTMVSTPPKGLRPSTEDPLVTAVDPGAQGDEGKANLYHPVDLKATPVTRAIGSQEIKDARRWRKTWPCLGAARMWIRLHLKFTTLEARGRRECPTTTPKEIFAAESEKFKPPPPMVTPADKRNNNKFCEFHNDKGHTTDEYVQLKKQIKELPWHKVTRQKVTLSFAQVNEIMFPSLSANKGTEGPLVIEARIRGHAIHRMYVDGGYSMEVLYEYCFNRLWPEIKSQMVPATTPLTGFSGETIWPLGQLRLLVTIGNAEQFTKAWMNFMIVRSPSPYNDIIGRPRIREIQAVPSMAHGMLKFPVDGGVVTIRSTILTPNECATITATSKDSMKKIEGGQKNLKVAIHHDFPDQEFALRGTLSIEGRTALCALLKRNLDIFTWQPSDMTGVPRQIAEHRLNIRDGYSSVRQKKRGQAPERAKAI